MDLSGTWRAAPADDDLRRVAFGLGFDDASWEPVEVPGHWRSTPAFAELDGPLIYRNRFRARRRPRRRPPLGGARGRVLPGRRVARRRLPGRPGGLLHPPRLRHHRPGPALAVSTCSPWRSPTPASATSAPSAPSPACSATGTASTPTTTSAACGGRSPSNAPGRCASSGCASCAARRPPIAPWSTCTCGSTPTWPARCACAPRSTATWSASTSSGWRRASTTSRGASASTTRRCGGRGRSASSAS